MHQSVTTPPDGLPPPSSSSAVTDVRNSTIHHQNHHGISSKSSNNGRSNSLLVGEGESGLNGTGLLLKSSSSSSPPKTQDLSDVNLSSLGPSTGNSNPTQPQPSQQQQQKQQQAQCSQLKTHHTHESTSGDNPNHTSAGSGGGGVDVLLQWGQRKRSKRTVGDKFSGSHTMPPPPISGLGGVSSRGGSGCGGTKLKPNTNGVYFSKDASSSVPSSRNRNLEDSRMGGGGGGGSLPTSKNHNGGSRSISRSALGKRSHSAAEKTDSKKVPSSSSFGGSIRKDKPNDSLVQSEQPNHHHLTSPPRGGAAVAVAVETEIHSKSNTEVVEWPRIYIALSRKEKEDDFFKMKGTKLPHRPKKRAKAIDRTLQYCFPGMWLSDLTRARYEVRERKNVKKPKRRGLKGLESMDSDSD